ncbi:histidine phosphatase family protein [Aldersonia sp. NBC_00410]|jgi:phosphohistidine phosphatase|uniref:SixA phosphatase family protein n=1 Tax=Aldersonia sp. NBC_00410 TaxID=2975954 RepID=UPI00224FAF6A|nr:histidine phosphatase family protein [Aldersonia sp. NBC_00410]MCX5041619.1 histidine phosphatase family protein [Aldersonia sp. NBC_00410]
MTTRTLILMRHGKSAYPDDVDDHDRPLAPRGQREAGLAGDWLRSTQPPIDAVRCSTSLRTRRTLAATAVDAPVEFDRAIYGGSPRELIEAITIVDDDVRTLLLVGHVPGIPWTAWELAENRSSPQAEQIQEKFPTSALAVLEFDRPWAEVAPGTGELICFHVPR